MFGLIWLISIVATAVVASNKNRSVAGFLFLAIFLGPFALVIVLLLPSYDASKTSQQGVPSLQEAKSQLEFLKSSLEALGQRIGKLEEYINQLAGKELIHQEIPVEKMSVSDSPQGAVKEKSQEGFELVFGKYWLNRIGVVLFVLGIGFFVSYAFQYLNALAKILVGYAFAVGFLVWGNHLEKIEKYAKVAWGILGGGWALMYLSTYAMHYIDATRIISDATLEVLLLALVSAVTVIYNLKYKSWVTTSLTFLLALITVGLGGMDYTSVILCTLLVGGIVYLSYKCEWHSFLILGIASCYVTYLYWLNPQLLRVFLTTREFSIPVYQFQISFGILLINWTLFTLALFLLEVNDEKKMKYIVLGNLINAAGFSFLGLEEIYRVGPYLSTGSNEKFIFLGVLAVMYFVFAYLYKRLDLPRLIVVCSSIAFTLFAMAILIKFPRLQISFFWILQMMIVFGLGIYYKEIIYRMMAWLLGLLIVVRISIVDFYSNQEYALFNVSFKHNILIFVFAAAIFYVLGAIVKKDKIKANLIEAEASLYNAFPVVATALIVFLLGKEVKEKWLSLAWTLQGAAVLGLGFLIKQRVYRLCALCVFVLASLRVIFIDISGINTIYKIIAFISLGAVLLGVSLIYSKLLSKSRNGK